MGQIRVRKFVDGVGETPLAIQNDRVLMGTVPSNLPNGAKMVAADRVGPGPEIDGTETQQAVITDVQKGFLVDCLTQTKRDKDELNYGFKNFVMICMKHGD